MNYTLHQLQVFLTITRTLSVTRAAEELHLTQPAVSIQLKNFQNQFDIPLTEIIGRRIYITEFGREIARYAETILDQAYSIDNKTQEFKGKLAGRLKISIVSTGKYVMPYFLSDFIGKYNGIQLVMDVSNRSQVIQNLQENEIDFALVSILPAGLQIEKLDLLQNKLFLVGPNDNRFNSRQYDRKIFSELPLIFREPGSATRQTMERFIQSHRITPYKKIELVSNEAVKQAILAGLGYSVMPLIGLRNEIINEELKIVPVKGLPIKTVWTLVWLKGKRHSPAAQAFIEHVKKSRLEVVRTKFDWYEQY